MSGEETSGSFEDRVCNWFDGSGELAVAVSAMWPAVAFGASRLVPHLRSRPVVVMLWIAVVATGFWTVLALVVLDVG